MGNRKSCLTNQIKPTPVVVHGQVDQMSSGKCFLEVTIFWSIESGEVDMRDQIQDWRSDNGAILSWLIMTMLIIQDSSFIAQGLATYGSVCFLSMWNKNLKYIKPTFTHLLVSFPTALCNGSNRIFSSSLNNISAISVPVFYEKLR